jgi:hypothetical protein
MDQVRMTLKNRNRWRIGVTIAAACVLGVAAVSCLYGVFVFHHDGAYREHAGSIVRGSLHITYSDRSGIAPLLNRIGAAGWNASVERTFGDPVVEWLPQFMSQSPPVPGWALRLPLWIPIVILGGAAGWLWWRHLGRSPHQCATCGYDLSGLDAARCPECGRAPAGGPTSIN